MTERNVNVTRPSLPPLDDLVPYLKDIWDTKILTNNGPYQLELEKQLCDYLAVPYISLFANGTLALLSAIRALNLQGEVITTPYTFVATANSLVWNNITPVFVDIDPNTLNLDTALIERSITERTSAIMPVHVYGYPCKTDEIEKIAQKHNLKVVYDAAHAFGVNCHCGSILEHGDASVLSFHATKVFNTFEGGAVVTSSKLLKANLDNLKNFGLENDNIVNKFGINAKMNEFSAAVGLVQLQQIDDLIMQRCLIDRLYRKKLEGSKGIRCHIESSASRHNFSYFPIFVESDYPETRDALFERLKQNGVNTRKYFNPLVCEFEAFRCQSLFVRDEIPNARRISSTVLCLPIYPGLTEAEVVKVCDLITEV